MSLAPGERRALLWIEESLSRSDPRLDAMLTTFRLPLRFSMTVRCTRVIFRCKRVILRCARPTRGRPPGGRLLALVAAGPAIIILVVLGGLAFAQAKPPICTGRTVRIAVVQAMNCEPVGNGTASGRNWPAGADRGPVMTAWPSAPTIQPRIWQGHGLVPPATQAP